MRRIYVFNEDKKAFGDNLKQLMKKNDLTIESLSDRIGYDENTIKKWRIGERTPSLDTLSLLAKLFNTTMQELYLPNSIYPYQLSDGLEAIIVKKTTLPFDNKELVTELQRYSDYLFQKMLFSFVVYKEKDALSVLFGYFRLTKYGINKLGLENAELSFLNFSTKVKEYISKQYGLSFPYKNNDKTRRELLNEFDKWISFYAEGGMAQ